MSEEEADAVLASALSFVDEFYAPAAPPETSAAHTDAPAAPDPSAYAQDTRPRRPSKWRDSNRSRTMARAELLALRARVLALESELDALRSQRTRVAAAKRARAEPGSGAARVWKDVAASQLAQRVRSACENQRLRALVSDKKKVLHGLRRLLVGRVTSEATREFGGSPTDMRLPALNLDVVQLMQTLSSRVDATYREVDALFNGLSIHPNGSRGSVPVISGAHRKLTARHAVPFAVDPTGDAAWLHLSRIIRPHATSLFSYRDDSNQAASTVIEYFGMKLAHGPTTAEFRVTQTMRRYVQAGRHVVVYESELLPTTLNGQAVRAGAFQERGVVRITPQGQPRPQSTPQSSVEVLYSVTPPHETAELAPVDALATFMLQLMASVTSTNFHKIENLLFDDAARRSRTQEASNGERQLDGRTVEDS